MNKILNLPEQDFIDLVAETARRMGIQPGLVEKDIWVCTVLERLFSFSALKEHLIFKGGTSLSKVYKLINRFSEDVDLIIDWRLLGYGTDKESDPRVPKKSNTQQDKFNKQINATAGEYITNHFVPLLVDLFSDISGVDIHVSVADSQAVEVYYPSHFSLSYIKNRVLLEIGPLASWVPWEKASIKPFVAEAFPNLFQDTHIEIRSTTAERSFWEKATILHQEAHRVNNFPVRYSRHYYDLSQMCRSRVKASALDQPDLLHNVVRFKRQFYPCKWANYEFAVPGSLQLIPPETRLLQLEKDYNDMKVMIFKDIPTWVKILQIIQSLEDEINNKGPKND